MTFLLLCLIGLLAGIGLGTIAYFVASKLWDRQIKESIWTIT